MAERKSTLGRDLLIILGAGFIVLVFLFAQRKNFHRMKLGRDAPGFTLPGISGKDYSLKDFRGKVVLLNFWATWCPPCKAEIPSLIRLNHMFSNEGLVILGISEDNRGADVVVPFAKSYGMDFAVLLDPSREVGNLYSIGGVPETFLVGKDGKIKYKFVGPKNWDSPEMVKFITVYLKEKEEKDR